MTDENVREFWRQKFAESPAAYIEITSFDDLKARQFLLGLPSHINKPRPVKASCPGGFITYPGELFPKAPPCDVARQAMLGAIILVLLVTSSLIWLFGALVP